VCHGPSAAAIERLGGQVSPPENPRRSGSLRLNELLIATGQVLYSTLIEVIAFGLDEKFLNAVDLDDPTFLDKMPEGDKLEYLHRLKDAMDVDEGASRESYHGLAQTELDRMAHLAMKAPLEGLVAGSLVAGEEATPEEWDRVMAAPPGTYVWILDAIDGSGPQDTVGFGYGVEALLYRTRAGKPAQPVMSVSVNSSALLLGWIDPGTVAAAYLNVTEDGRPRIAELLQPLAPMELVARERGNWVSVVAAQADHRSLIQPLLDGRRWVVMTLGGAPAMAGILVDKLAALVIPSSQTRHDAAPLLALASGMGLSFVEIRSGAVLSDAQVRRCFLGIERPGHRGANPAYRPIPAMAVARALDVAVDLAAELREHWRTLECDDAQAQGSGDGAAHLYLVDPPVQPPPHDGE
jgi:hypothetical protein